MIECPACSTVVPEGATSCPSCGAGPDDFLAATWRLTEHLYKNAIDTESHRESSDRGSSARGSADGVRFVAGEVLAARYRIVGLLGRGGMGEVYRADDLTLGQTVAIKFLPDAFLNQDSALMRFRREVRVARQITHPNVCRVYDIGEADNQHFLTMEYIKGEELASVLKRFGRLPTDKATEIAYQICAGLSAAHKSGVIHRDLKPANVMIDDAGNARITDFGVAALAEELRGEHLYAGTPAYMSPEQFAGKELTTRSDIYSLGLVLYELFTGKRAFDVTQLQDLRRVRESGESPTSPSSHVKDLDPSIERVILRCLEKDPQKRPGSALQVAAALPGGDPLAAALAIGETPSPEMVAAAPKEGTLRPALAVSFLVALLAGIALAILISNRSMLHSRVPLEKSSEVLRERASELVRKMGYTDRPVDHAYGFLLHSEYLRYVRENDQSPNRWDRLRSGQPAAVSFWYRQSPHYIVPQRSLNYQLVTASDPPVILSGMSSVFLDSHGRLLRFEFVPEQIEEQPTISTEPDWSSLFIEAGLDPAAFTPTDSKWVPPANSDVRRAWQGVYPASPEIPIRVEAASFRGRPIYFQIIEPWTIAERTRDVGARLPYEASWAPTWAAQIFRMILIVAIVTLGVLLARHNLRSGRGDRRGAFRLAAFAFMLGQVSWLIGFSHVPTQAEFDSFFRSLVGWSFTAILLWLLYISLEPYVRRRWPHRLISWSRLLAGEWRDPFVGRDILIGGLCGVASGLLIMSSKVLPGWFQLPEPTPYNIILSRLLGTRTAVSGFLSQDLILALTLGLGFLFLLLLLQISLRREWLAVTALCLILTLLFSALGDHILINLPFGALGAGLTVFVLTRLGLLAMTSFILFQIICIEYPLTSNLSAWYAEGAIFAVAVAVGLALYGFYTSLGGQRVFRGRLFED